TRSAPPEMTIASAGRALGHPAYLADHIAAKRGAKAAERRSGEVSTPALSILDACDDPELLGRWFRDRSTWAAWFAFLAALFGLPMTPEQQEVYRRHTGREGLPGGPFGECWLACGRRSGKSFTLALIAVFLACFRSYSEFLGPGERGTVMVIAADRRQARVI